MNAFIVMKHALRLGWGFVFLFFLASGPVLAHKNETKSAISYSANPVTEGTDVTITATVLYTGTFGSGPTHSPLPALNDPVVGDTVQIQQLQVEIEENVFVGVACGTPDSDFNDIDSGPTNGSGQFSTVFDTTDLGGKTICFRALHPDSGGQHGNDTSSSPGVDLVINAQTECTPGATVAATLASGDGTPAPGPNSGPWTYRITVTACGGLTGVTAQGGSNGWAGVTDASPDTGSVAVRKQTKKNTIHLWTIGDMTGGQVANLDVTVDGPIPNSAPDCQIRFLNGPWSATYSTDDGATFQKSEYSGRVTVSVDTDGDGNPNCP